MPATGLLLTLLWHRCWVQPPPLLAAVWRSSAYPYHPHQPSALPATLRLLTSLASALASLLAVVVFYVYLLGSQAAPGTLALPSLTPPQFIALAVATALFVTTPLAAALSTLLHLSLLRASHQRYPELALEAQRRKAVAAALLGHGWGGGWAVLVLPGA